MTARLNLTGILCADCPDRTGGYPTQLGQSGIYVTTDGTLLCIFCAADRASAGEAGMRCVLNPGPGPAWTATRSGWANEGEPLTPQESAALLLDAGAQVVGKYHDPQTGDTLTADQARAALLEELGMGQ